MATDISAPAGHAPAVNGVRPSPKTASFAALTIGSIGVVYGDIGTSPLYAFREALVAAAGHAQAVTSSTVIGVLSLILWALIVIVTLKYVFILLRADNKGEGGTLALMALAQRALGGNRAAIVLLGIVAAALFYGDAILTPALSVLSAVEGLKIATVAFEPYVVPLTVLVLVALFAVQSHGTARVAAFFGPITLLWFAAIAFAALPHIARAPEVLLAFNPLNAIAFVASHGMIGLVTLGAVFLAVTGAEALYADLGHFGRRPIQTAWLVVVLPSLALNYLGQGALVIANPKAIENPFFLMYPDWALYPMVGLATAATVIASQAVITGAYSLTQQAIQLGLLPRFEIRHTSEAHAGQIFMPAGQLPVADRRAAACSGFPLVERACICLRHCRHRNHGGHRHDGLRRYLEGLELVAAACSSPDCAVPADRHDVSDRQSAEGVRGWLGSAGPWRGGHGGDVHVAARQSAAV